MAHLWIRDETGAFCARSLSQTSLDMGKYPPASLDGNDPGAAGGSDVHLIAATPGSDAETWALIWGDQREVWINGLPLLTGIRILTDRDEIRIDSGEPMFFSTETLACVETFPGADREYLCLRCKRPIETGSLVVRCPICRVIYHQDENQKEGDWKCWTYSDTCATEGCPGRTELKTEYEWVPDDL